MTDIKELLKNCPKGYPLDCLMYDNVTLDCVYEHDVAFPITIRYDNGKTFVVTKYGQYDNTKNAKCVIFPKGCSTWDGFNIQPKPGDIVVNASNETSNAFIYKGCENGYYKSYGGLSTGESPVLQACHSDCWVSCKDRLRYASEKEKDTLFNAIAKEGYKWNPDTYTFTNLKKQFSEGDIIYIQDDAYQWVGILKKFHEGKVLVYASICLSDSFIELNNKNDYLCNISDIEEIRLADFGENAKFHEVMKSHKTSWNEISKCLEPYKDKNKKTDKFNPYKLNPFDKVLVRQRGIDVWCATYFSHYVNRDGSDTYPYVATNLRCYAHCVPYEGNEHLLGKTDDCDEYYKTWDI